MTSMARSQDELKASTIPMTNKPNKFSYGTSISLNKEEMAKLGIKELPELGDEYSIVGVAKVTSASSTAREGGTDTSMELQLTHMTLTHEDAAEEKAETPNKEKSEQIGGNSGFGWRS
jgi:CBS-domain-containing membrane protein